MTIFISIKEEIRGNERRGKREKKEKKLNES